MRTLAQVEAEIIKVEAALEKVYAAQAYSVSSGSGSRSISRASIDSLTKRIDHLYEEKSRIESGGIRIIAATPV